jgi:FAD/FMN-containing dehydrogenase/Fe-S oxidoreductase
VPPDAGAWERAGELERALRARVRGEVRFEAGSRALYATDGSNYRQVPIGVVIPSDAADVEAALEVCRRFEAPILARGGGTSLAGQCCNAAVVFDFSKRLNRLIALDPERKTARVEPGLILDDLRNAAEKHHLTFGPDPSTHTHCVLGGMIGNNSCGVHSVMAGRTVDNVHELDIITYDGLRMTVGPTTDKQYERIVHEGGRKAEIYKGLRDLRDRYAPLIRRRFPKIPRRVSGYSLDELLPENGFNVARALVGSESTCALTLSAEVRLVDSPPARSLLVLGYYDVYEAADHVLEVLEFGPVGLEGLDQDLVQDALLKHLHTKEMKLLPDGGGWLLAEFGGRDKAEADAKARACMVRLSAHKDPPSMKLYDDRKAEKKVWEVRESGLGATAFVPGSEPTWEGWEDAAVPPETLGSYLRKFKALLEKHHYKGDLYGHFGQGCVHTRISFDLFSREGVARYRAFIEEAAQLVVDHGGSLSGEHGDGQSRAALLPKMYGPELVEAFRAFKRLWDPAGKMNPGKKVDAFDPAQNLRLGPSYAPLKVETHFAYPEDNFDFSHAGLRCVGVGKCRRLDGGVMCPSFMHTREEKHSTRGRAHLLFEMLRGETLKDGWRDEAVKEALDLCLACKGCKGDCPVNVDMATYKAEFLAHYYEGLRLRPRAAYAMGQIRLWSGLASLAPGAVNALAHAPLLSSAAKWLGGVDARRELPRFAPRTLRAWLDSRPAPDPRRERVLLFPDTFTDRFHPEIGEAAVEVLEAAGYGVAAAPPGLCCGRPLYDYGFLTQAKRYLRRILDALREDIRAGTPMLVLEPSCAAVFRDEMTNLFPNDQDARRLGKQTFVLAEFFEKKKPPVSLTLKGRALVQGHCHQKSVIGFESEQKLLEGLGLQLSQPEPGCCGMAGSFGFEAGERCDLSLKVGERLLKAVKGAGPDELLIADGFSCREQIAQGTGRRALHLAQVLKLALRPPGSA